MRNALYCCCEKGHRTLRRDGPILIRYAATYEAPELP